MYRMIQRLREPFYRIGLRKGYDDQRARIYSEFASSGHIVSLLTYFREQQYLDMPAREFLKTEMEFLQKL